MKRKTKKQKYREYREWYQKNKVEVQRRRKESIRKRLMEELGLV